MLQKKPEITRENPEIPPDKTNKPETDHQEEPPRRSIFDRLGPSESSNQRRMAANNRIAWPDSRLKEKKEDKIKAS